MPYSRAPIAEAVIDLRPSFDTAPDLARLKAFTDRLRGQFPIVLDINSFAVNFAAQAGRAPETSAKSEQLGYRLSTERNDRILQVAVRGLVYSHMPPYTDWERFSAEFRPLWDEFVSSFGVTSLSRIALRYINRLTLPIGRELDDYINLGPRIPEGVSKALIGYFAQLVLPVDLGPEYRVIINTGVEPVTPPGDPVLLLDIDMFGERSFAVGEVWEVLEHLRAGKNRIFEASITDKVREMIR